MSAFTTSAIFRWQHYPLPFNSNADNDFIGTTLRPRLQFAGAFLFVVLLGVIAGVGLFTSSSPAPRHFKPTNFQANNVSVPTPATALVKNTDSASADISTVNAATTNSGGASSANVSVNGRSVNVPANGSTQQTISSPNGQTKVSISSSQSNTGSSTNSSVQQTNLNVSTTTTSTVSEDSTSP